MAFKSNQNRTIVLPIAEKDYHSFVRDNSRAGDTLACLISTMPECFPVEIHLGFQFNGRDRVSKKTGFVQRRIKVAGVVYRIRPSFLLSYQRGRTDQAAGGLMLIRHGVPFWVVAHTLGRNAMWWYRLFISLSLYSIVGTTIRYDFNLPEHLLFDEHHIKIQGKKAYVATTVGHNCFLGMDVSSSCDQAGLQGSYEVFKLEAADLDADYQPITGTVDGWWATQNVLKVLYPMMTIIECFLHGFLKVRDRATKKVKPIFELAADKIWDCYKAESKRSLAQKIRRLKQWATKIEESPMQKNILKFCEKKELWAKHLDYPDAYRTSNSLDRLMRCMKKHAFNSQMFHGKKIETTTKNFRALALLHNFTPYYPSEFNRGKINSPAAKLNGFTYHDNWLHNLLISASLGGFRNQRNPL